MQQRRAEDADAVRRIWWAIGIGTVVQTISYVALIGGAIASASDETLAAGPVFALGFILVPVVSAIVAFVSRHERAPIATLKGMGIWLVVGLPLGVMNPISGLSAGFAASGVFTLRPLALRPGRRRWLAVLALLAYVTLLVFILPQAALFAGAATPLLALRVADMLSERAEDAQASAEVG